MEDVCIPPVDSKVSALPTRDVLLSSPEVGKPDNPVMDDAALGTVESNSLFPTTAGGALVSTPNELSNEDIGSTSCSALLSLFDVDRAYVGGIGEIGAGAGAPVIGCALIDGTNSVAVGLGIVGTNSAAVDFGTDGMNPEAVGFGIDGINSFAVALGIDGIKSAAAALGIDGTNSVAVDLGLKVGTNSLAVARINPIGFSST